MKTKFVVFNDRITPMSLRVIGADESKNPERYLKIDPASMATIELELSPDTIPFLKIWENNSALLTYVEEAIL